MKHKHILALLLGALVLITSSCGTSDKATSVTISSKAASSGGFYNLVGADGTLQLIVTANYTSGKTVEETNYSTFQVTTVGTDDVGNPLPPYGPTTVPISPTGLMTIVAPLCTWTDLIDPTTKKPATPPIWAYTGYYQVTATYKGIVSQPIAIGAGSLTSNSPTGGCGP